ncbi:MAG: hypothetical protein ACTSPG_09375, partial [Candidatus Hodarchaeales archaeon]
FSAVIRKLDTSSYHGLVDPWVSRCVSTSPLFLQCRTNYPHSEERTTWITAHFGISPPLCNFFAFQLKQAYDSQ